MESHQHTMVYNESTTICHQHSKKLVFHRYFEARSRTTPCKKMMSPCLQEQCNWNIFWRIKNQLLYGNSTELSILDSDGMFTGHTVVIRAKTWTCHTVTRNICIPLIQMHYKRIESTGWQVSQTVLTDRVQGNKMFTTYLGLCFVCILVNTNI